MEKRSVDTEIWINEIVSIVNEGYEAPLNVTGKSMLPFLRGGRDRVLLKKYISPPKNGDILLFRRQNGDFVLHRVVKVCDKGVFLAGDIQGFPEGPVKEENILAVVSKAYRKGKWTAPGEADFDFFSKYWHLTLPLRRCFGKAYAILRSRKQIRLSAQESLLFSDQNYFIFTMIKFSLIYRFSVMSVLTLPHFFVNLFR